MLVHSRGDSAAPTLLAILELQVVRGNQSLPFKPAVRQTAPDRTFPKTSQAPLPALPAQTQRGERASFAT
jgi:hypothetical protein